MKIYSLEVDLIHVTLYNADLAQAIQTRPGDTLPLFEAAAAKAAKKILFPISTDVRQDDAEKDGPDVQILVKSGMNMLQFRDLTASRVVLALARLILTSVGGYIFKARQNTWYCNIHFYTTISCHQAAPQVPCMRFNQDDARSPWLGRCRWRV